MLASIQHKYIKYWNYALADNMVGVLQQIIVCISVSLRSSFLKEENN